MHHRHDNQHGVALVLALYLTAALSVIATGLMFLSQVETYSSANYRTMSQARYGAEAGVNKAVYFLLNAYTAPTTSNPTDPFAAYDISKSPVQLGGKAVVLSTVKGTSSNYADASVVAAFLSAASGSMNLYPGSVAYSATATMLAMRQVDGQTVITWQITGDGVVAGARPATVEVTATLEKQVVRAPGNAYAAFATSGTCGALDLNSSTVDSYDSTGMENRRRPLGLDDRDHDGWRDHDRDHDGWRDDDHDHDGWDDNDDDRDGWDDDVEESHGWQRRRRVRGQSTRKWNLFTPNAAVALSGRSRPRLCRDLWPRSNVHRSWPRPGKGGREQRKQSRQHDDHESTQRTHADAVEDQRRCWDERQPQREQLGRDDQRDVIDSRVGAGTCNGGVNANDEERRVSDGGLVNLSQAVTFTTPTPHAIPRRRPRYNQVDDDVDLDQPNREAMALGNVHLTNHSTLTLHAGTYNFNSLKLDHFVADSCSSGLTINIIGTNSTVPVQLNSSSIRGATTSDTVGAAVGRSTTPGPARSR
ncbi:MAG: pilus assembly PilX N-terminal domain-containing protein [Vicinamibacterales bacterium]